MNRQEQGPAARPPQGPGNHGRRDRGDSSPAPFANRQGAGGVTGRLIAEEVLATLREVRQVARSLARRPDLPRATRTIALSRLLEKFPPAEDPWLARAVRNIVWAEAGEFLRTGRLPVAPDPSWRADPVTLALWHLRRRG